MNDAKYIGLDVHQATISVAVRDSAGKLVMEAILETKAETILPFLRGLRGSLHVTFEEGTWAGWLHDLLQPHVTRVLVCDPRKNALLKAGNKSDRIDARKLSDLLYLNKLSAVYHGEQGIRTLKELARSYITLTRDLTRVMSRLKALYRSWAIPCAGEQVYSARYRAEWLAKFSEGGVRRRAELYYQQFDSLAVLRQSTTGTVSGRAKASDHEVAAADSHDRSDPRSSVARADPDTAPFSHQAATLGLLRIGLEDLHQWGIPLRGWPTPTLQEGPGHSRAQPQPQPRPEKYLQGCRDASGLDRGTFPGLLPSLRLPRHEAVFGTAHLGTQDRRYYFARLEERSAFRR